MCYDYVIVETVLRNEERQIVEAQTMSTAYKASQQLEEDPIVDSVSIHWRCGITDIREDAGMG
jgi:hypothetical protein